MKSIICLTLGVIISWPAIAQPVIQAASTRLQPQIGRDDRGYSVCGVRAIVIDDSPKEVEMYDFSINVRADIFAALVKAGKSRISHADLLKQKAEAMKVALPAPLEFWIAGEAEGKALRIDKQLQSQTPGFILGGADLIESWKTILAIAHGERMQFALRYKGQGYDNVVSFGASMPDVELQPLMACLTGLEGRLRQDAQKEIEASERK